MLVTSNGRIALELPDEVDGDVDIRVDNGLIRALRDFRHSARETAGPAQGHARPRRRTDPAARIERHDLAALAASKARSEPKANGVATAVLRAARGRRRPLPPQRSRTGPPRVARRAELLAGAIRIDTTNPPGREREAARHFARYLGRAASRPSGSSRRPAAAA